jgi:calcium permeable stress-gated cation channel
LFFLQSSPGGGRACLPHAIIMIITFAFTFLFQYLINRAFGPLFTFLPITFEDEAVQRDEAFQRAQAHRWQPKEDEEHRSLNSEIEEQERAERRESKRLEEEDRRRSQSHQANSYELTTLDGGDHNTERATESPERYAKSEKSNWATRSRSRSRSHSHSHYHHQKQSQEHKKPNHKPLVVPLETVTKALKAGLDDAARPIRDIEAQTMPTTNLFDDIDDQLEDIEPEVRQKLIKRSFQHPATRAIQPAIWIPQDDLGVALDEIERTAQYSKKIWVTSVNARLDASGNVLYRGLPPDRDPFENIEV